MTRRTKIVLSSTAGLFVAAVVGYRIWTWEMESRFEAKVAAIAMRGEPTTLADLVPPDAPDGENAATFYLKAFAHPCFEPDNAGADVLMKVSHDEPLSARDIEEARRIVERAREPLALLREAATRKKCRFATHYASAGNPFAPPPHWKPLQDAVELVRTAAQVDTADGRVDDALADSRALIRLAAVRVEEMWPSSYAGWVWRDAAKQAERALNAGEASSDALRATMAALSDVEDRAPLLNALRRERCWGIELCRQMLSGRREFMRRYQAYGPGWVNATWDVFGAMGYGDASRYLDMMDRFIADAAQPYHARDVKGQPSGGIRCGVHWLEEPPWRRPFTYYTEGDVPEELLAFDRTIAHLACLKVALALRLHRLKHGVYPELLAALVPEFLDKLPLDPFSGKDLVYRREGKGFVVYSLDWDGADDNGVPSQRSQNQGDIVFRVSR